MMTGIEAGLRALGKKDFQVVGFAGDGGTGDIGIQALSGAIERNDNVLYICYDNEAYMNTGIQKSSLTPFGARTTTTPAGRNIHGIGIEPDIELEYDYDAYEADGSDNQVDKAIEILEGKIK